MKATGLMILLLLASAACAAYRFEDLPTGWAWEQDKILGELLPAEPNAALPANDPNLWLCPLGHRIRQGGTNQWVEQLRLISVVGGEPFSTGLYLHHDPNTRESTNWTLESWSVPGPWYITLDAISYPGRSGVPKIRRYTVVGAGYIPDDYVPEVQ